jgi:hypothetical protein
MAGEPITILTLGPMSTDPSVQPPPPSHTLQLKLLVESIRAALLLERRPDAFSDLRVIAPDDRQVNLITRGVLDFIEQADLVIVDLSRGSPNVAYEVGLVHALGLPHILLTDAAQPPFYFQSVEHIMNFAFEPVYNPQRSGHVALRDKILAFMTDPNAAVGYADNQVTEYYEGLPIIDISGPSGVATGYYINGIRRFVRGNGFLDYECSVSWKVQGGGAEESRNQRMRIDHFISILPPGGLAERYSRDDQLLRDELAKLGFRIKFATIENRSDEPGDLRPYGGLFLARTDNPDNPMTPGVIVEIPTALYPLQFAPRVRRIDRPAAQGARPTASATTRAERMEADPGDPDELRRRLRQRRFAEMIASFRRTLEFQMRKDQVDDLLDRRYHIIALADLEGRLRQLGLI